MIHTTDPHTLSYLSGLGNAHASQALEGALPRQQNTPRHCRYGLVPEQINGTVFTARRELNERSWIYKIRPSIMHSDFSPLEHPTYVTDFSASSPSPELFRWRALEFAHDPLDIIDSLHTLCGNGSPEMRDGLAIHTFAANADMVDKAFVNADGDMLFAPDAGSLLIVTEFGLLHVEPGELAVIPRGLKFSVSLPTGSARGFALEIFNGHFKLPERGVIGANGLADERHFLFPTAAFEDRACDYTLVTRYGGRNFGAKLEHSPFDVVAWHGNYAPYKYDLSLYNSMGSVSFDHPDPSILTVLTCPRDDHGRAIADVVVFPGRWEVAEHTFRPPFHHRNAAAEFSAILKGPSASPSGYNQGVSTVTPNLTAHGINATSFYRELDRDEAQADEPHRIPDDSLWLMVETAVHLRFTPWAMQTELRDRDFRRIHEGYHSRFDPND